jgi:hypothetical protein
MAGEREVVARFHREARAVAAISHPDIITIETVEHIVAGLRKAGLEIVR